MTGHTCGSGGLGTPGDSEQVMGAQGRDADPDSLDELTYLLESGSERIDWLDFQLASL
ncbi:hypothetical protein GNG27_02700 [Leclercia sp. 119287]|uniref:hypothetical protein n=1 Tax=Leclercia sp. 119287 TaxID=2681308 RepID=UPI0012E31981|nr:hypothetical protein [Leclercia sp. 119287]QGU13622.1 hypothetical protein GNG27_02700 [Leclercia sp. 119287]